jgi:hypothetical protein
MTAVLKERPSEDTILRCDAAIRQGLWIVTQGGLGQDARPYLKNN